VDWGATWQAIRGASPGLLAAAAVVNLLSLAVKGVRWWIFLRPAGAPSLGLAVRATAAGAGLNNVLVANGGDAARIVFVTRRTGLPSATVLATLALERVFDAVGYVVLLVGAALVLPLPPALARFRLPAELLLVGMVVALGVLALRRPAAAAAAAGAAAVAEVAVPTSIVGRARRYLRRFGASVAELSSAPRFLAALALSLLAWAGQLACFHLTAMAAGVQLTLAGSLAALLAVNAGLLVRATPGNVGVFQLAYALAATQFGAPRAPAIAVALLIQALQILPTTLLGVALAPEFVLRRPAPAA
jgi:phosphatidylinositol alpha-mannosyltransferase